MAKAKETSSKETLVDTLQDNNFADREREPGPRGSTLQEDINAIRDQRAAQRKARGPARKRRMVTNYHDAERLHRLVHGTNAGPHRDSEGRIIRGSSNAFPELATAEEIVDWEEAGLLPNPEHYATGSTAAATEVDPTPPDEVA